MVKQVTTLPPSSHWSSVVNMEPPLIHGKCTVFCTSSFVTVFLLQFFRTWTTLQLRGLFLSLFSGQIIDHQRLIIWWRHLELCSTTRVYRRMLISVCAGYRRTNSEDQSKISTNLLKRWSSFHKDCFGLSRHFSARHSTLDIFFFFATHSATTHLQMTLRCRSLALLNNLTQSSQLCKNVFLILSPGRLWVGCNWMIERWKQCLLCLKDHLPQDLFLSQWV